MVSAKSCKTEAQPLESDAEQTPLFWPAAGIAAALLAFACYWHGRPETWTAQSASIPLVVHLVADGLEQLPRYWLALASAILAVGASLGANALRTSIIKSGWGALVAASICLMATASSYLATAGNLSSGMSDGGALGVATLIAVLLAFGFGAANAALLTWAPVAIAAIAVCIIIHALLNLVNGLPMPWQPQEGEEEVDTFRVVNDLGSVAAVFVVLLAVYDLVPGFVMPQVGLRGGDSVEAGWRQMDWYEGAQPSLASKGGSKAINREVEKLRELVKKAVADRCDVQASQAVSSAINNYFWRLRRTEDWKPGQPLSAPSQTVATIAAQSLEKKIFGWDNLKLYARIHLDTEKYAQVSYEYPLSCP
jgi:hypothetical protein